MGTYTTVRLDDALGERLQALAQQRRLAVSTLARRLIESALERSRAELSEAYLRLYSDADDRSALVALAHAWLPDEHQEAWRAYGRADGPWEPPSPGHGDARDELIADSDVLALYRHERLRRPCDSYEMLFALAATSAVTQITLEVDGDVGRASAVGHGVSRIRLSGYYWGYRMPSSAYDISLKLPSSSLDELTIQGRDVPPPALLERGFMRLMLALAAIGDPAWREGQITGSEPTSSRRPFIRLEIVGEERRRRGRGSYTLYHKHPPVYIHIANPDINEAATEAARAWAGKGLQPLVSAVYEAGRVETDEAALAESAELARELLDWMLDGGVYAPMALLDWVPCMWTNGVMSALRRITHYDNYYSKPLLSDRLKEITNDFTRAELVRRAAVSQLLRRLMER